MFSFVNWPFSVKLLWAPIVDSVFSTKFGRRKSWLVPTQYLIGLFMLILSGSINSLLGEDVQLPDHVANATSGENPEVTREINIYLLTGVFLALNFLAATQVSYRSLVLN